jgi:hypothetical protein
MALLTTPEVAMLSRAPYYRWLQIAFPVRQRTQFVYGCYLGEVACRGVLPDAPGALVGMQLIRVGQRTTVGVPGKQIVVEPGSGYGFDPRCMLVDNAIHKVLWHPWMVPLAYHTPDTRRWLLDHPEWIPRGYIEHSKTHPGPIDLHGETIYVADAPTPAGDRQSMTTTIGGHWGYKGNVQADMPLVVDLESSLEQTYGAAAHPGRRTQLL